ncbi:MAG: hypothetical protein NTZ80_01565 [Patescibacteria group bacterium]|nr:hypothetical protein [Patescibacteria group bacterium]
MKTCPKCQSQFEITPEDLLFYDKVSPIFNGKKFQIPSPTLCQECRAQRKYAFRNERKIYKRKCDLTGANIVSLYSPDKPHTVYRDEDWWSDSWDVMSYGRDFDFNKSFFEQFKELILQVPRRGMQQDGTNENCEYTTYGRTNKNCYLAFGCINAEDAYHCSNSFFIKNSIDCLWIMESELMYECVDCKKCYNLVFSQDCHDCQDSYLLDDCRTCHHCIACKNLRNKKYHIYNKPVSQEEFAKYRNKLIHGELYSELKKFDSWKLQLPFLYARLGNSENSSGEYMENAKNCDHCFDMFLGAEDCKYCCGCGGQCKDTMDCVNTGMGSETVYEAHASTGLYHSAFNNFCRTGNYAYYCENIGACDQCFGCVGLNHKKYCILNKQYSKEAYEQLVSQIIEHMIKSKEWGEFFHPSISPFGYNETIAQDFLPVAKERALQLGFNWSDYEAQFPKAEKIIKDEDMKNMDQKSLAFNDDILNYAIECEITKKPFRIIKQELDFYRKMELLLPHLHPDIRHQRRLARRSPRRLYHRTCGKQGCNIKFDTAYSPSRPEIVYCEKCYLETVY